MPKYAILANIRTFEEGVLADLVLLLPTGGEPVILLIMLSDAGLCAAEIGSVVGSGHRPLLVLLVVGMTAIAAVAAAWIGVDVDEGLRYGTEHCCVNKPPP